MDAYKQGRNKEARIALDEILRVAPHESSAWFMRAVTLANEREFARELSNMQMAFALELRQTPANRLVYANILVDSGDPTAGETQVREILRTAPRWGPALNALGTVLQERGKVDEAIAAFDGAFAAEPEYVRAVANLAEACRRVGT